MAECSCTFTEPRHEWARTAIYGRAVYLDEWHDETRFDPACPFHGENGTMVVTFDLGSTDD